MPSGGNLPTRPFFACNESGSLSDWRIMKLGIIGYGRRIHGMVVNSFRRFAPELQIVGVVDPDEEGVRRRMEKQDAEQCKFYPGVKELVLGARPDALAIGTRCNLHAGYAIEASQFPLPLFLEKPVATSMEQALALEEALVRAKAHILVSFPLRLSPLCQLAKRYLSDGAVGRPDHICGLNYVHYGTVYFERGYSDYSVTQGLFLQKATHDFDYMQYLMGENIVRVAAMATRGKIFGGSKPAGLICSQCEEQETCLESPINRKINNSLGSTLDHECVFAVDRGSPETGMNEESSSALLEFASGAHGIYTQVFFTRRNAKRRGSVISGYHGTLEFDWYRDELRRVRHHEPFTDTVRADAGEGHHGGDLSLARNFVAMVRSGASPLAPIATGLQSVYACLAAKKSSETGQFVEVRQLGA